MAQTTRSALTSARSFDEHTLNGLVDLHAFVFACKGLVFGIAVETAVIVAVAEVLEVGDRTAVLPMGSLPPAVPSTKAHLDIPVHAQVLDITCETLPRD